LAIASACVPMDIMVTIVKIHQLVYQDQVDNSVLMVEQSLEYSETVDAVVSMVIPVVIVKLLLAVEALVL
jgi:hypothetical protein